VQREAARGVERGVRAWQRQAEQAAGGGGVEAPPLQLQSIWAGVEGRALARSLAHGPGGIQRPSNGSQPTAAAQVPCSCAQGSTAGQAAQEPTLRRQAKQPTLTGSWPIARPAGGQKPTGITWSAQHVWKEKAR